MQFRRFKLRFKRRLRERQQQVEDLGVQAERGLERNVVRRFERLLEVKRFVLGWLGLMVLLLCASGWQTARLSVYYQNMQPVPGGIYSEGVPGSFTNANPLYATSEADTTVSRLLFASLFRYNDHNKLVGELASDYTVDPKGATYTIHLKPGLVWQDGQPLTSKDVVFTYRAIQNPDAQSPLRSSWQGVDVTAPDARTVVFTLPGGLASFLDNLTNGIVPEHLLAKIPMADLRSAEFNTEQPVGAGPFKWQALQVSSSDPSNAEEQIALVPFAGYAGGQPKLKEFILHIYANSDRLAAGLKDHTLTAAAGLPSVPGTVAQEKGLERHSLLHDAATMVFFKTSEGALSDAKVRQALVAAADPGSIIRQLGYDTRPVREPFLQGQLGYDPAYTQKTNDVATARKLLSDDGWAMGKKGILVKDGKPLAFTLSASDTPEYRMVAAQLQQQWKAIGVHMDIDLQQPQDFNVTLQYHQYDAVLYGIATGLDPDVFVYWDSSQADIRSANRLNLSEYKSSAADVSLEAGRTRLDPALRIIKYRAFLQAWQQDAPALGLYQPRFLYLTNGHVYGFTDHSLVNDTDRFSNVQNWEIRTAKVTNP